MNEMSIGDIIKDFRSIKLTAEKRAFIDRCRTYFENHGNLPVDLKSQLRIMTKQYSSQFNELHEARARARKTIWRKRHGVTIREAKQLVEKQREKIIAEKADVGL